MAAVVALFASLPTSRPEVLSGKVVGGWSSVLPPLSAVVTALCFRSLVGALAGAFVLGCVLSYWPRVLAAVPLGLHEFVWTKLTEQFSLYIFAFLFALVGMIHVVHRAGGITGLVNLVAKVARGPRSTKVATCLAGLAVFFDDYSNTVVIGQAMRGLCDRFRVSREKLSYLVDSTSAPVAGLAPLSTWIAFEVFLFSMAAASIGIPEGGYEVFLKIVPLRFYCWGTLAMVLLSSATHRDFGPMLKAETRAAVEGKLLRDGARPLLRERNEDAGPKPGAPLRWANAAVPLGLVLVGTLGGIVGLGAYLMCASGRPFSLGRLADLREAFGMVTNPYVTPGGAMLVLFLVSALAGVAAVILVAAQRILTLRESGRAYLRAVPTLGMAFFILVMAWGMGEICTKGVHTDTYLISLLGDRVPLALLPMLVFLIACGMSFATGTSFGTMGILIPIVFQLAHAMGAYATGGHIVFWLCASAVMDGAIFGDHCSPISDTTVLSSMSSACDHLDHVATQMPYAVTVMLIAAACGYVPVALGLPAVAYFAAMPALLLAVLFAVGRRVPSPGV